MTVDRKAELNKLLKRLRGNDRREMTDVDIVLEFLEDFLAHPYGTGGSSKLTEFNVETDQQTMTKTYKITWNQTLLEIAQNEYK